MKVPMPDNAYESAFSRPAVINTLAEDIIWCAEGMTKLEHMALMLMAQAPVSCTADHDHDAFRAIRRAAALLNALGDYK